PEPNGSGGVPSIYSNAAGCNTVAQIVACPGFAGGGGSNNAIVTPNQPCPDCPSTAIGENWQVMAFPNPANKSLTVEIEGNFKQGTVGLTDLAGRELLRQEVSEGETQVTLQLDEIGGGLYFLQVRSGEGEVQVIRVVVAK
ncbi:MAG: T9SS type A sorting domain-containing protein, partial [Bacteroidota bacterium]